MGLLLSTSGHLASTGAFPACMDTYKCPSADSLVGKKQWYLTTGFGPFYNQKHYDFVVHIHPVPSSQVDLRISEALANFLQHEAFMLELCSFVDFFRNTKLLMLGKLQCDPQKVVDWCWILDSLSAVLDLIRLHRSSKKWASPPPWPILSDVLLKYNLANEQIAGFETRQGG